MKTNTTVISALGIISEFAIVKLIFFLFIFHICESVPKFTIVPLFKNWNPSGKKRLGELLFSVWGGPLPTSAVQTSGGAADLIAMRACTHFEQHHKPMGIKAEECLCHIQRLLWQQNQ